MVTVKNCQLSKTKSFGLTLCARFAYPPNSLSLCGPLNQTDLSVYSQDGFSDAGTSDILSKFHTLNPYLEYISRENRIGNKFSAEVVEAYWLGNRLLKNITLRSFEKHLKEGLNLKKILNKKNLYTLLKRLDFGAVPSHNFHVLNIYRRTNHQENLHTVSSMDACRINWGEIVKISKNKLIIETYPLITSNYEMKLGKLIKKTN